MAVGCTLCVDCATIHRKLGAEFSKLRALWLDKWSPLMLKYLARAGGNANANAVWEAETPSGWVKPDRDAPSHVEDRAGHRVVASTWVFSEQRPRTSMARFGFAPRDDRSSKNEPKRVGNDRDTRF